MIQFDSFFDLDSILEYIIHYSSNNLLYDVEVVGLAKNTLFAKIFESLQNFRTLRHVLVARYVPVGEYFNCKMKQFSFGFGKKVLYLQLLLDKDFGTNQHLSYQATVSHLKLFLMRLSKIQKIVFPTKQRFVLAKAPIPKGEYSPQHPVF